MRRLLMVLVLVVAGIVGLGFYQGWFRLATGDADGKASVPVVVDQEKIEQDKQKVQEVEQQVKDKVNAAPGASKEGTPRP